MTNFVDGMKDVFRGGDAAGGVRPRRAIAGADKRPLRLRERFRMELPGTSTMAQRRLESGKSFHVPGLSSLFLMWTEFSTPPALFGSPDTSCVLNSFFRRPEEWSAIDFPVQPYPIITI